MLFRYHAAMVVLGVQGSLLLHTSALAHSPSVQNIARAKGCGRKGSVPQQQDMLRRRFRRGPGRGGVANFGEQCGKSKSTNAAEESDI